MHSGTLGNADKPTDSMGWGKRTVKWDVRPFINGQYRSSSSEVHVDNINPASEAVLCTIPSGTVDDVNAAVDVARLRFSEGQWASMMPRRRAEVLRRLADLVVRDCAEIALLDTLEMGKPITASLYDAGQFAPSILRSCADLADRLLGSSSPLSPMSMSLNVFEPRGIVGAICPWNFPCVNAAIKIAPALVAGNSVVLKPSEISPSSAIKLAALALEAGLPEGVFNVVPGLGSTVGAALAAHHGVDLVSFTGSTSAGRVVMELAGRSNGKPVLLECGGKSPHVVFSDISNIDYVADSIVTGFLANQGQVCSAHSRVVVDERLKNRLLDEIVARARNVRPQDPLDEAATYGPLASPAQRDRVKKFIEVGVQSGADAVLKGEVRETGGCYVSPTVFDRVDRKSRIVQEEIFGPVLCVQTFSSEEEAIALANGTDFGLAATVWTRDLARGRRMAHEIKAGIISIRTSGVEEQESGAMLDFEPRKASGFGSELGLRGIEAYSTLKSVRYSGA